MVIDNRQLVCSSIVISGLNKNKNEERFFDEVLVLRLPYYVTAIKYLYGLFPIVLYR